MALVTETTDFKVKAGIIISGTSTVTSSTGQTGTLQVSGGAAIAKNIKVGGDADFYGKVNFYGTVSNTTNFDAPIISYNTTTASTNAGGEGALVLKYGGAYVGDNLIVMSTAYSTSTGLDNALYVNGGAYIKEHLTVEGPALFKNPVTFSGSATFVLSTNTYYTDNVLELHVPPGGIDDVWTLDDGKDIGIRFHYYETTNSNAAMVFANDTKSFEFYKSGAEGTSTFSNGVYGGIKTGNLWLVDTTATSNTYTGALIVDGGAGIAGGVYVGDGVSADTLTARTLTDTRLVIAGAGGRLYDYADLTYNTGTNIIQGTITTATNAGTAKNIAGGSSGALVYQTGTNLTNFVSIGTATYVLTSDGSAPYWAPTNAAPSADTATNIANGLSGQIPFQEAPNKTTFSSALTFITATNALLVNGGNTATGHIAASGNISSSSTVFTEYLRVAGASNSVSTNTGAATVAGGVGIGQDLQVGGTIVVGAVVTNTNVSALTSNNLNISSFTKSGITGNSGVNLDSYSGSDYRSSKYFIQAVDGTDVHVTEMSVFHDGTTAYKTEYGYHYNNGVLGTFNAVYTASSVVLTFLPVNATDMTIKVTRWSLTP